MSFSRKINKLISILSKPNIITGRSDYLFMLSHMRSRSSVLSHVLGSNNGICGYSELHASYNNYIDILRMRVRLHDELKCDISGKYLFDKILHDNLEISRNVIKKISPKFIFLLREPESTIKSIFHMGHILGNDWHKNPDNAIENAANYYCTRLSCLQKYAEMNNGNNYFIESDDLLNKTDDLLKDLTDWLNLASPLQNRYSKFSQTGKPGRGDPSENIQAGKITKTKSYSNIEIPREILKKADSSYEKCKETLLRHCVS